MKAIAIEISRVVDDGGYPTFVECLLIDAMGQRHRFVEKEPVVSATAINVESLPAPGVIACEVESEWLDSESRLVVRAATTRPWGVESTEGCSNFVVFAEQLREI
ncbi:hypothetical protein QTH89_24615 [Variovorax sp. J22G21]|uniref:hypothetical protein n=1 Tax=Variovorax fucosicus TaxID=3053517 RepID=UPI002575B7F6|nr:MULTISPECIES: hypothetical protein [unclassified Variovorax]MDM0039647.1 hypothetical protein [Variovorax sp. J22R193]MDM0064422.1 hypothetical protein [Variovorax sp. J22G21]